MGVSRYSFLDRAFLGHCNWFCSCCRVCSIVWFWNWVFIRLFTSVGFATGNGLDVVAERVYIVAAAVLDEGSLWAAVRIATHSLKSIFDQFLHVFARIIIEAKNAFEETLTKQDNHQPHFALFLAFLRLFEHARALARSLALCVRAGRRCARASLCRLHSACWCA